MEYGRPLVITGSYLQDWLLLATDYNWRIEPEAGGESRAVADVGSHWCDLLMYITDQKITRVYADLAVIHKTRMKPKKAIETYAGKELTPEDYEPVPVTTEDYGTGLCQMDGGRGRLVCQVAAGRKNRCYEIDCENAAPPRPGGRGAAVDRPQGGATALMRDASCCRPRRRPAPVTSGHPKHRRAKNPCRRSIRSCRGQRSERRQGPLPDLCGRTQRDCHRRGGARVQQVEAVGGSEVLTGKADRRRRPVLRSPAVLSAAASAGGPIGHALQQG